MRLQLEQVSFSYFSHSSLEAQALSEVDLCVDEGEFIGVIGRTGSGKSTLLQILSGLIKPSAGKVFLDGADIHRNAQAMECLRRNCGIVFQRPENQLFAPTLEQDVMFGPLQMGLSETSAREQAKIALEQMGFDYETVRNVSPFSLSGGEKRKAAIAGILAMQPRILLLDEPISGLDPRARVECMQILQQIRQTGVSVIMVSHSLDELSEYASRMIVIDHGKAIMDDSPQAVFSDPLRLQKLGLGISQIREITWRLQEKGISIDPDILDYPGLIHAIQEAVKQ